MRKTVRKVTAFIVFMLIVVSLTSCFAANSGTFELTQKANSSSGVYWEYSLNNDDVIREAEYYETRFWGPGYTQHWKFEKIADGNVTVHWTMFHGGGWVSEKDSYDVTYEIKDGKLHIL